ncbi:sarcospan [Latimeria chalumnae]|uniref:Sarcospan n=1 Tax=Latimeria chalumnae TaxID=7897 RepID=H3AXZ7_LATCH|nr:PREDICTED: sarcospan [Latimeria chalumnae]|eukprot:XP_006001769.1 PREDICTED: sarcospan [Latimeria chalumnae]
MRVDENNPAAPLSNQNPAEKPPEGEKKTDPATAQKKEEMGKKKKEQGNPKASQEEESHTCCGCRFPLLIALLQLVLGVAIAVVAFIMAGISSSLLARDTPHWAGIIVCLVALLGLCLYCITYQADEHTSFQFVVKLAYFLMCTLGLIICTVAVAFAGHHYMQITHFACEMTSDSCKCKLDPSDQITRFFTYKDVSDCTLITSTVKLYLLLQMVLNLTLAIVCLLGCFIMWKHRYQVFFVGVRLHSLTTTELQQQKA